MTTNPSSWLKQHSLVAYFTLTYVMTWTIWAPIIASAQGWADWDVPYALHYFGSFGPAISAFIITALSEGVAGIRNLLSRIFMWRVEFRYYVFAILAPIGLFMLAYLLNRVVAGEWSDLGLLGEADYLPHLGPFGVLGLWLLTYGLGEETGWRGFALSHLQKNRSAASATLILALLWATWHLPAFFFRDTYVDLGVLGFPLFAFMMIFSTMTFTWLYNSTRGSVFMVIVFHAVFNWLSVSEAGGQFAALIMSAPIVLWALYIARRYGQENAAPPSQTGRVEEFAAKCLSLLFLIIDFRLYRTDALLTKRKNNETSLFLYQLYYGKLESRCLRRPRSFESRRSPRFVHTARVSIPA